MENRLMLRSIMVPALMLIWTAGFSQSLVGLPNLQQIENTTFELNLRTDSTAIITVHASLDTTYRNTFIFLGKTVGDDNRASIKMDGLKDSAEYIYRVFIGQHLTSVGGSFTTGPIKK